MKLKRVAQDGMRASAGAASFRRQTTLERGRDQAREQGDTLKPQIEDDPGAMSRRQQAAQARAKREREARGEKALERVPELAKIKAKQGKKAQEARASSTDPEAPVRKRGDGGDRPAYHAPYATATQSQGIVGVEGVTVGSEMAQMAPLIEQVPERGGHCPEQWRVEGGDPAPEQREAAAPHPEVYAPVPKPKDAAPDPHAPKPPDSEAVAAWRERRGTEQAKALYQERAATAECVHAPVRERGLSRVRVRGKAKGRGVLLRHALAHNLRRRLALTPEGLGLGTGASEGVAMAG